MFLSKLFIIFALQVKFNLANVCLVYNPVVPINFCSGQGKSTHVGDFNGDKKEDFVCHDSKTGQNVIHYAPRKPFEPIQYTMPNNWCSGVHSRFFVGDFNGDGRSDFLCHTVNNGYKWIAYADKEGKVTKTNWKRNMGWCSHKGSQLFVGDFNGDRRTDILCHDNNGAKWISYADKRGQFLKTNWHKRFGKCKGVLLTGDFNGDGKTDIVCHEKGSGKKYIALAGKPNEVFTKNHWAGQSGWCTHGGSYLKVGDVNGDGRDDLICKDSLVSGGLWYSMNTRKRKPMFRRTTFHTTFCSFAKSQFFQLADVTGNGKKDFLCLQEIGFVQIAESKCL